MANFSDDLAEHPDGAHLAKYLLVFAPAWHIWADLREIMNSYYTDDIAQRLVILWVMALLVLYANNAPRVDKKEGGLSAMRTTRRSIRLRSLHHCLRLSAVVVCFALPSYTS